MMLTFFFVLVGIKWKEDNVQIPPKLKRWSSSLYWETWLVLEVGSSLRSIWIILFAFRMKATKLLSPFQIIGHLIFLTPNLTTYHIQKFVQNIISFVGTCFINTTSSGMTSIWLCLHNIFFWIRWMVKLWVKKVKQIIMWNRCSRIKYAYCNPFFIPLFSPWLISIIIDLCDQFNSKYNFRQLF